MSRYLIDTNIIIYITKGNKKAFAFMEQLYADKSKDFLCSAVTEAELFSTTISNTTQEIIEGMLSEAEIIHITSEIARKAGEIRAKGHEKGYKIKLPDALIAATAKIEDAIIVTHNVADFHRICQVEEIDVLDPME